MTFTPFIVLIAYFIILGILLLMALLNIYHILRFGMSKITGLIVTLIFLVASAGIIFGTFELLGQVDWQEPINISVPFINANNGSQ